MGLQKPARQHITEEDAQILHSGGSCDACDYLIATGCGAVGGIIDVFLVGSPKDNGPLKSWADEEVDRAVKGFARLTGWKAEDGSTDVARAIHYLEKTFKVNYDQRYGADVGSLFEMSTRDHHMKSLAHSPDLIGLFFSILNQFTSTASFVSDGRLITVKTDLFDPAKPNGRDGVELMGHSVESKLFCGVVNWLGHVMSDAAGSSLTRRFSGDGTGVPIPFYELFQFCDFRLERDGQTLADLSIKIFQEGYDARFGLAMSIPVIVTDLLVRLVWALRRHFQRGYPIGQCMPTKRHDDLRVMLIVGNAALCLIDAGDALVRSGGGENTVALLERMNIVAWFRLVALVVKEVSIRASLERDIEAMRLLNKALNEYLEQLKAVNVEQFETELLMTERLKLGISAANTAEELNAVLKAHFDCAGIDVPWRGSFDEHMGDKTRCLYFS